MSTISIPAGIVKPNRHGIRAPKGGCTVGGKLFKGGQFCLPFDPAHPHGQPAPVVVAPAPVVIPINGFTYEVREIPAGECGTVAYRMTKRETNNAYDVIRNHFGEVTCDCPDYEFKRAGTGRMCKHGAKLVELGMIPAPGHPRPVETDPQFDGRALYGWARARNAVAVVAAFGRANDFPGRIVDWTATQATTAYYEAADAVEGVGR
jgi:hypothetical protein